MTDTDREGSKDGNRRGKTAGMQDADARLAGTDGGASPSEVILRVGAEGGDLTLYGTRSPEGWRFSRRAVDLTMDLLDLDDGTSLDERSAQVGTWSAALALMDRYPWHRLYPLEVHPDFRERVLEAVAARYAAEGRPEGHYFLRWQERCSGARG